MDHGVDNDTNTVKPNSFICFSRPVLHYYNEKMDLLTCKTVHEMKGIHIEDNTQQVQ